MDYREFYKKHYNIDFGRDYQVHHIDGNRENNDISNLLLLPTQLHQEYHQKKEDIEVLKLETQITGCRVHTNNLYTYVLNDFLEVLSRCNDWYDYKSYLDGEMPNIHNIHIGD